VCRKNENLVTFRISGDFYWGLWDSKTVRILAIDTATLTVSVAVVDGEQLLAELNVTIGQTHSVSVMPIVENAIRLSQLALSEIDAFAFGLGPGSFTGIRIGAALAKGFALATSKPAFGVSTLSALSLSAMLPNGLLACVLDARRDEVFVQCFSRVDGVQQEVFAPRHLKPESAGLLLAEQAHAKGGGALDVLSDVNTVIRGRMLAGAGTAASSLRFAPRFAGLPLARWVAQEVLLGRAVLDDGSLQPLYVRPIDAKLPTARVAHSAVKVS
jgi:tRNA threonylcarbamoyladenosine biosynthesis protein TsaB